jgi:hypothetical protein
MRETIRIIPHSAADDGHCALPQAERAARDPAAHRAVRGHGFRRRPAKARPNRFASGPDLRLNAGMGVLDRGLYGRGSAPGTPIDMREPRIVTCHDLIPLVLAKQYLAPLPGARTRITQDSRLRSALCARGLEHVKAFTWERCARQTLACYARALDEGPP